MYQNHNSATLRLFSPFLFIQKKPQIVHSLPSIMHNKRNALSKIVTGLKSCHLLGNVYKLKKNIQHIFIMVISSYAYFVLRYNHVVKKLNLLFLINISLTHDNIYVSQHHATDCKIVHAFAILQVVNFFLMPVCLDYLKCFTVYLL